VILPKYYFDSISPAKLRQECANELVKWPTAEHYYQAQKFCGTTFEYLMAQIQAAPTPKLAAKIGRNTEHQPRADWDLCKCDVMYRAVWQKFNYRLDIQQILLDTLDAEIVEDSPTDYFWGCGIDRTGANHLGRILMRVRDDLKDSRRHELLPLTRN
jgi:N-glycosidase YbiA